MEPEPLTAGDKDFLKELYGFAQRRAVNGVWLNFMRSLSHQDQRFVVIVAFGEQADAIQKLILDAQMPNDNLIEVVPDLSRIEESGF